MLSVIAGRAASDEMRDNINVALGKVMDLGLWHRLGLFLAEEELHGYDCLLRCDAPTPPRLAVCDSCKLVFVPRRQETAKKCAHCHHRSSPHPVGWSHVDEDVDEDVIVRVPDGQGVRKLGKCAACGGAFFAKTTAAVFCSPGCSKGRAPTRRLWTAASAGTSLEEHEKFVEDFTAPLSLTLQRFMEDRRHAVGAGVRNAACYRCSRYYRTREPERGCCPDCGSDR